MLTDCSISRRVFSRSASFVKRSARRWRLMSWHLRLMISARRQAVLPLALAQHTGEHLLFAAQAVHLHDKGDQREKGDGDDPEGEGDDPARRCRGVQRLVHVLQVEAHEHGQRDDEQQGKGQPPPAVQVGDARVAVHAAEDKIIDRVQRGGKEQFAQQREGRVDAQLEYARVVKEAEQPERRALDQQPAGKGKRIRKKAALIVGDEHAEQHEQQPAVPKQVDEHHVLHGDGADERGDERVEPRRHRRHRDADDPREQRVHFGALLQQKVREDKAPREDAPAVKAFIQIVEQPLHQRNPPTYRPNADKKASRLVRPMYTVSPPTSTACPVMERTCRRLTRKLLDARAKA